MLKRIAKDRTLNPAATFNNPALDITDYEAFLDAGFALEADSGEQLEQLFDVVARRIKLLMVH